MFTCLFVCLFISDRSKSMCILMAVIRQSRENCDTGEND